MKTDDHNKMPAVAEEALQESAGAGEITEESAGTGGAAGESSREWTAGESATAGESVGAGQAAEESGEAEEAAKGSDGAQETAERSAGAQEAAHGEPPKSSYMQCLVRIPNPEGTEARRVGEDITTEAKEAGEDLTMKAKREENVSSNAWRAGEDLTMEAKWVGDVSRDTTRVGVLPVELDGPGVDLLVGGNQGLSGDNLCKSGGIPKYHEGVAIYVYREELQRSKQGQLPVKIRGTSSRKTLSVIFDQEWDLKDFVVLISVPVGEIDFWPPSVPDINHFS